MRDSNTDSGGRDGGLSDWVTGGQLGSKGAVLVFRSSVLAAPTASELPFTADDEIHTNKFKLSKRLKTPESNSKPKNGKATNVKAIATPSPGATFNANTFPKAKAAKTVTTSDGEDFDHILVKINSVVSIPEAPLMPARQLQLTYKLLTSETKLLHRLLRAHGLMEAGADSGQWTLLWAGPHPKPDVLRSLTSYQRVNHFPRSYELTRKDKLFKNIEKMQYFRGFKNFDFIPQTFIMPTDYKGLCSAHYRTKGPWIVKPCASSRGRGIYIVNAPDQIPKGENVVVAKYIDKPLLIGGHKCDLRLYVCVTSIDPLLIYLYEEGLVRFATVKYDKTNKNLWNPCMHLCNYSINKYHIDYVKSEDAYAGNVGHKWTLSALLRHLRMQGRDTAALMSSIEDMVVKSILSSAQTIATAARAFVPHTSNCFELFGYDILIDDSLKPWLLEVNLSPSLACESPLDAKVKSALLADTLTLVGLPALERRCRRAQSAENVCGSRGQGGRVGGSVGAPGACGAPDTTLSRDETRLLRVVRAQYRRRGGYVRIFPSANSWQQYSQYLDPVSGVPVCSTSSADAPRSLLPHNYNLLVHSHAVQHPHTTDGAVDITGRLQRYERVDIAGAAPAVDLDPDRDTSPRENQQPLQQQKQHDARRAREIVTQQLEAGMKLSRAEGRRAFGLFLTHVLRRLSTCEHESTSTHAALVHRFLKKAALSVRAPYYMLPADISDKDRCAVVAKQLSDFLNAYHRETDLGADDDAQGCVSDTHFSQFLHSASEAELEEVLLLALRAEHHVTTFLGGPRHQLCVNVPADSAHPSKTHHLLLRRLAHLAHFNTRRYKSEAPSRSTSVDVAPRDRSSQRDFV